MKKVTKKAVAAATDNVTCTASFEVDALLATREQLIAAFRMWCIDARTDKCLSLEESAALSADTFAESCAEALISYLGKARALSM